MKIFLDANVIVVIVNKEYPVFSYASRILSLADRPQHTLFTSPVGLAIAYYFAEKKTSAQATNNKITILLDISKLPKILKMQF